MWVLNESVFEHLRAGIKVEAANTYQTSEKIGSASYRNVIEVGKNDLEDSTFLSNDTDEEVASKYVVV